MKYIGNTGGGSLRTLLGGQLRHSILCIVYAAKFSRRVHDLAGSVPHVIKREHHTPVVLSLMLMTQAGPATESGGDYQTMTSMKHADAGSRWRRLGGRGVDDVLTERRSTGAAAAGGGWCIPVEFFSY